MSPEVLSDLEKQIKKIVVEGLQEVGRPYEGIVEVKLEEADTEEQGGHAFRVMDAYARACEHGRKVLRKPFDRFGNLDSSPRAQSYELL